jgi:putative redox protein
MPFTKLEFPGASGARLAARLELPADEPRAYALFAHCFTCTKDILAARAISQALAAAGIAVLRFDFTGLGHSEGEFAHTNFSSNLEDLVSAADFLRDHYAAPQILVGHSLGGTAVLAAAGRIEEAKAVATIGAPFDPAHVAHLFGNQLDRIHTEGEAEVSLAGRPFRIRRQFLEDLAEQRQAERIATLQRPLLVMHAPLDDTVSVDNARLIFQTAKHPKSFVSLDDADHLLSRRRDADYVATVLASWASRYLDEPERGPDTDDRPRDVLVVETGNGRYQQIVSAGPHRWSADEPADVGGDDTGPNPYELLLSALGACTAITLRMYANLKKLPLEAVEVRLQHRKIHARDCRDCETAEGRVDFIARDIRLQGPLNEDQRKRLMAIADRCPVHQTLHKEVEVESRQLE